VDTHVEFTPPYLLHAHDLSVVKHVSDRVAVMYLGKIVETADGPHLYQEPKHPYTGALLSAVPMADPELARQKRGIIPQGDVPQPTDPPSARRGSEGPHPRCVDEEPELTSQGPMQRAACHFPLERSIIGSGSEDDGEH